MDSCNAAMSGGADEERIRLAQIVRELSEALRGAVGSQCADCTFLWLDKCQRAVGYCPVQNWRNALEKAEKALATMRECGGLATAWKGASNER